MWRFCNNFKSFLYFRFFGSRSRKESMDIITYNIVNCTESQSLHAHMLSAFLNDAMYTAYISQVIYQFKTNLTTLIN